MKKLYLLVFLVSISFCYGQSTQSEGEIDDFSMYPNPVTEGKVYISTLKKAPKEIFIYDVFGTLILKTKILGKELSLADLDAGVYVIRVLENNKVATRKLIIK